MILYTVLHLCTIGGVPQVGVYLMGVLIRRESCYFGVYIRGSLVFVNPHMMQLRYLKVIYGLGGQQQALTSESSEPSTLNPKP